MAGKVFFSVTMSLDGFIAPEERLGHSSIAITLDIYSHVAPGMQEAAAAQLGALVFG